ncbi:Uncharacterised protein [Salmonella enterica subsp. arizonae]|nr:Uncharacterised protein [Salmonella enterica subsp. arizonae]
MRRQLRSIAIYHCQKSKLSPIHDTCKLLKVNGKIPLVSPHF